MEQAPKLENVIIDSVPGINRTEPKPEAAPVQHDRIVHDIDFKGDPSRVIGHPSNPNGEAMQAFAEQLGSAKVAQDIGEVATSGSEIEIQETPS